MSLIPFFAYDGTSLLAGLTPSFDYFKRLDQDGTVTDLVAVSIVEKGSGAYYFNLPSSYVTPNCSINYVINLGGTANPATLEGHLFANEVGVIEEVDGSSYSNEGIDQRPEIQYGSSLDTLVYYAKANGVAQAVDSNSAYVTILDPGGSSKVARTQTGVLISGSKLSFTQAWAATSYELWEDFVAVWEWQSSGLSFTDRQYFDVVRNKLPCMIDESDILEQYPDAEDHLLGLGITDATRFVKRAWSVLLDRIRSGKSRPALILDRARLVNPALEGATARMCRALAKETGDIWHERMTHHFKEYNALVAALGDLKYDLDEDGLAGNTEKKEINRRVATV